MKRAHRIAASLLALAAFWPLQAQADARHDAYLKAAQAFVAQHRLPDGETIDKNDIDGSFSGKLVPGNGVFAQLLLAEGIPVRTEEDL